MYVCTCVCVCAFMCLCVCAHVCLCVCTCVCVCVCACACVCVCVCVCVYVRTCVCVCVFVYVCLCVGLEVFVCHLSHISTTGLYCMFRSVVVPVDTLTPLHFFIQQLTAMSHCGILLLCLFISREKWVFWQNKKQKRSIAGKSIRSKKGA